MILPPMLPLDPFNLFRIVTLIAAGIGSLLM